MRCPSCGFELIYDPREFGKYLMGVHDTITLHYECLNDECECCVIPIKYNKEDV